jgi:hypothetical protein
MNITITINTDNAAFENMAGIEVARILRKLADMIEDWPGANEFTYGCRDANGNKVGSIIAVES